MAPRALGAALASFAALLIAVSLATSAWWSGHPTVDGRTITRKDVHVGLHGAKGCNLGEAVVCEPLEIGAATRRLGFVELGAGVLALAGAAALAFAAWQQRAGRKGIAKLAIGTASFAALGAIVVVAVGPQIKAEVAVGAPIGWGWFAFLAGAIAEGAAGVVTLRDRGAARRAAAQPPAANDVRESLRDRHDGLRPSLRGGAGEPLFDGAPQLRPLYEMPGAVPIPASQPVVVSAPILPTPPPQPLPAAAGFPPIVAAPFATPRPELIAPPIPRNSPTISHAVPPPPIAEKPRARTDADEQTGVSDPPQPEPEPERERDRDTDVHEIIPAKPAAPVPAPAPARSPLDVGDSTDQVETIARPKFSAEELAAIDAGTVRDSVSALTTPKARVSEIPISTAPASLPPPKAGETATAGPAPACPQCEAPMAWVEEHLRFYCKSCRMYF